MRFRSGWLALCLVSSSVCAAFTPFPAGPSVDIRSYGAVADDGLADTPALVAAMAGGGRTVVVPAGRFDVGEFEVPSNTVLQLSAGTVLQDTGQLALGERLINIRSSNVRIVGTGATVSANRSTYTTGEHRHGVFIFGARNVEVIGLESSTHGGDGFYIGGPAGSPATDIALTDVSGVRNRRQGLSIVSGVNVFVNRGTFKETTGTRPSLGVDIEPNNSADRLLNIRLQSTRTEGNDGGGIGVGLSGFGPSAPGATISIVFHASSREAPAFVQSSLRASDKVVYTPCCLRL